MTAFTLFCKIITISIAISIIIILSPPPTPPSPPPPPTTTTTTTAAVAAAAASSHFPSLYQIFFPTPFFNFCVRFVIVIL